MARKKWQIIAWKIEMVGLAPAKVRVHWELCLVCGRRRLLQHGIKARATMLMLYYCFLNSLLLDPNRHAFLVFLLPASGHYWNKLACHKTEPFSALLAWPSPRLRQLSSLWTFAAAFILEQRPKGRPAWEACCCCSCTLHQSKLKGRKVFRIFFSNLNRRLWKVLTPWKLDCWGDGEGGTNQEFLQKWENENLPCITNPLLLRWI